MNNKIEKEIRIYSEKIIKTFIANPNDKYLYDSIIFNQDLYQENNKLFIVEKIKQFIYGKVRNKNIDIIINSIAPFLILLKLYHNFFHLDAEKFNNKVIEYNIFVKKNKVFDINYPEINEFHKKHFLYFF